MIKDVLNATNLAELAITLNSFITAGDLSAKNISRLYAAVEETYVQAMFGSAIEGHPSWCVCGGRRGANIYLYRNWQRGSGTPARREHLKVLAQKTQSDFIPSHGERISFSAAESILRYLDKRFDFSKNVLGKQQMVVLLTDCEHKQFSSLCRPFICENGAKDCDIYMCYPKAKDNVSVESMLFHELGHVLNVMLTGNINIAPESYMELMETELPGFRDEYGEKANELFAHAFAMGAMYHSPFEKYDPFPEIPSREKELLSIYVMWLIWTCNNTHQGLST